MATQPDDSWWQSAPVVAPANDVGPVLGPPPDPMKDLKRKSLQLDIEKKQQELNPSGPQSVGDPSTWDQPTKAMVKALAEGRKAFPSGSALRAPYWQDMLARVSEYDPGFDETNYTSRAATRKDFSIGTAGKNIRALNTAIGHLGQLYGQIDRTASHGLVPLNVAENAFEKNIMGDSGPTNYASTVSALSGELTAVYRGTGGAEADIQRYINELSPNASEAQKRDTIKNIAGLLNSRLEALQDQYKKGLGVGAEGYQFLDPKAEHTLGIINGQTPPGAPPPAGPGGGGGGGGPPGLSDLTDNQKQAYAAFLAANPKPDGGQIGAFLSKLTGKTVTNGDEIAKAIAEGRGTSSTVENLTEEQKVRDRIAQEDKLGLKDDPATTLAMHGGTLGLSDEAAGIGNALANPLHPIAGYGLGRDVERQRIEDARQQLGYGAAPIEFVGGMASANPTSALAALKLPQMVAQGAKGGAAAGALAGFGQGEGASQSITGLGVGAAGGAAVGALAPYAVSRLAGRPPAAFAPDVARAAEAESVNAVRPMVDPASASRFNSLRDKSFSGPIIDAGVNKAKGQIADRVSALGEGGTALEPQAMGDAARGTGLRYITQTGQQFNRLYGQIRQGIGDTKISSANLAQQIDGLIADLSETPKTNAEEIKWLKTIKSDYADKDMSVDALRGLRTKIRQQLSKGDLTFGQNEARVSSLADAASIDISKGLQAAGKGDLAAKFGEVDAAYRDRMGFIGDTVQKLIGKRGQNLSGEQVFQNLKAMAGPRGSASGITRMREQMTPEEASDMAATFAESLGKDTKGDFSLKDLVKQTDPRKMPLAMRKALFGDAGAQSLENLRMLSRSLSDATSTSASPYRAPWRQAARAFVSNLTRLGPLAVGGGVGAETGSVGMGVTAGTAAAAAAGVGAARRVMSARAMVNPRVSAWLNQAADVSTPSQAKDAVKGLSLVISREPALARELTPIRDFLDQRVEQLLAAQPDNNDQEKR